MRVPFAGDSLLIVMLHLSLGERSRRRQLEYVAQQIGDEKHVVVMGDMNTQAKALRENSPLSELCLQPADESTPTYPAWRPRMALDHVLVSPSLEVKGYAALDCQCSDHLPVAVEIAALDRQ